MSREDPLPVEQPAPARATTKEPGTRASGWRDRLGPRRRPRWTVLGLHVIPMAFFAVFFVLPLGRLILTALQPGGQWSTDAFTETFSDGRTWSVVWFTLWQAAASTALTLALALPGAWVLARFRFRGRGLIQALSVVAFVMPTVVVAAAISATLAPDGPLGLVLWEGADRGLFAIFLAHMYFNVSVVLRIVGSYWSLLDRRIEQAASALGAPGWRVLTSITLPRLAPSILSAAALVYLFTFTSFGVIVILGEFGQATIEAEIQREVLFNLNLDVGAVLSILQLLLVLVILLVQGRLSRRLTRQQHLRAEPDLRRPRTTREHLLVGAFVAGGLLFLAGPVLLVLRRALHTSAGWGLEYFTGLSSPERGQVFHVSVAEAVANSLVFALAATAIAVVVGGSASLAIASRPPSASEAIWLLPLGVSAVTLGFGMLITFDSAPLNLRSTPVLVPVAQALIAIPFVIRSLVPVLRSLRGSISEAASVLGASPGQVVRFIQLPMTWRSLLVAMGFSFAISMGEFGATVFVSRGDNPTIPVAIWRSLSTPGEANYGQAMAMAAILILITGTVVLVTERLRLPGSSHV